MVLWIMLLYLLVFAASLLVDLIPFIGPPAWTVMVFFQVKYRLNIWIVLVAGVLGSTIGRYVLTLYIPRFTSKVVNTEKDKDLEFLGKRLSGNTWKIQLAVFVYTLIPIPTTPLFTAIGMAKVKPLKVVPAFFIGKFLSDLYMVYAGKVATENMSDILHGIVSWKTIIATVVCILFLSMMLFIDWKTLVIRKKLKFNFKVWK
jgi:membrane protein YqaA with SNARE-associated domain